MRNTPEIYQKFLALPVNYRYSHQKLGWVWSIGFSTHIQTFWTHTRSPHILVHHNTRSPHILVRHTFFYKLSQATQAKHESTQITSTTSAPTFTRHAGSYGYHIKSPLPWHCCRHTSSFSQSTTHTGSWQNHTSDSYQKGGKHATFLYQGQDRPTEPSPSCYCTRASTGVTSLQKSFCIYDLGPSHWYSWITSRKDIVLNDRVHTCFFLAFLRGN